MASTTTTEDSLRARYPEIKSMSRAFNSLEWIVTVAVKGFQKDVRIPAGSNRTILELQTGAIDAAIAELTAKEKAATGLVPGLRIAVPIDRRTPGVVGIISQYPEVVGIAAVPDRASFVVRVMTPSGSVAETEIAENDSEMDVRAKMQLGIDASKRRTSPMTLDEAVDSAAARWSGDKYPTYGTYAAAINSRMQDAESRLLRDLALGMDSQGRPLVRTNTPSLDINPEMPPGEMMFLNTKTGQGSRVTGIGTQPTTPSEDLDEIDRILAEGIWSNGKTISTTAAPSPLQQLINRNANMEREGMEAIMRQPLSVTIDGNNNLWIGADGPSAPGPPKTKAEVFMDTSPGKRKIILDGDV